MLLHKYMSGLYLLSIKLVHFKFSLFLQQICRLMVANFYVRRVKSGEETMKAIFSSIFILIVLLLVSNSTFAGDGNSFQFKVDLSGAQEISPPAPVNGVDTVTTGKLQIFFNQSLSEANFRLHVQEGATITQAHLHCGRAGENGPVVVFLFGPVDAGVDVDGTLTRDTLFNADITDIGPDCKSVIGRPVNNIASLASAARDGLIYVNVHSVNNPAGEVRGQLPQH